MSEITLSVPVKETLYHQINQQVENLCTKYVSNSIHDSTSLVRQILTDTTISNAIETTEHKLAFKKQNNIRDITIHCVLEDHQKANLRQFWPEYKIVFTDTSHENHALAHANRILEIEECMRKSEIRQFSTKKNAVRAIDIGGNALIHLKADDQIHSCMPNLSVTDGLRNSNKLIKINRNKHRYVNLNMSIDKYFCHNIAQKCPVSADTLFFIHSTYDMKSSDIADIMHKKKATKAYGSLIFDPKMLLNDEGVLTHLKLHWAKFRKNGKMYIRMSFLDDSSHVYEHKISTWLSILKNVIYTTNRTKLYHVEIRNRYNGIILFEITANLFNFPASEVRFNIWYNTMVDCYTIPVYDYTLDIMSSKQRAHIRKRFITVDKQFYDIVRDFGLNKTGQAFNVENVQSAASSFKNRVMINGDAIVRGVSETLKIGDLEKICTHIFLSIYESRYEEGKVIETIVAEMKKRRDDAHSGFISAAWKRFKNLVLSSSQGYLERLLNFKAADNYFDLKISTSPHVMPVSEYVRSCEQQSLPLPEYFAPIDYVFDETSFDDNHESKPSSTTVECHIAGRTVLKPMDGNCLIDSFLASTDNYTDIQTYKSYLLKQSFRTKSEDTAIIKEELLKENSLLTTTAITHLVNTHPRIHVCLHLSKVDCQLYKAYDKYSDLDIKVIHILLRNQHYSPIFASNYILPTSKLEASTESKAQMVNAISKSVHTNNSENLTLIPPRKVGYSLSSSIEIQDLLHNLSIPLTMSFIVLNNKESNKIHGQSGILDFLATNAKTVYRDSTLPAYNNTTLISLTDSTISTIDNTIDVQIFEYFDYDVFYNSTLFAKRTTHYIFKVSIKNLHSTFKRIQNHFHYIELHRSAFTALNSTRFYIYATALDLRVNANCNIDCERLLNAAYNRLFLDFSRAINIINSPSATHNLLNDDYSYIVYKFLKPKQLAGGVLSTLYNLTIGNTHQDTNARRTENGLYKDFEYTPFVSSLMEFRSRYKTYDDFLITTLTNDNTPTMSRCSSSDNIKHDIISQVLKNFKDKPSTSRATDSDYKLVPIDPNLKEAMHYDILQIQSEQFQPREIPPHKPFLLQHKAIAYIIEYYRFFKTAVFNSHREMYDKIKINNSYVDGVITEVLIEPDIFGQRYAIIHNNKFLYNETGITEFSKYFTKINDTTGAFVSKEALGNRVGIASQQTEKFLEPEYYDKIKYMLDEELHAFEYTLINGVPGCGKTRAILNRITPRDLVLFPTRESKADFIRRNKKFPGREDYSEENFLTVFSYLCRRPVHYERVFVDEARLSHPAVMLLVAIHSRCKELIMYGDANQIPYINRSTIGSQFESFSELFINDASQNLTTSYRCPVDVTSAFKTEYAPYGGFKTKNKVNRSLTYRQNIGNDTVLLEHIARVKPDVILTFTQSEKRDILNLPIKKIVVNTIHEFQGQEAKVVMLVRKNTKDNVPIYSSANHVLVAMTRHTKEFAYISYGKINDLTISKILSIRCGGSWMGNNEYRINNKIATFKRNEMYKDGNYNFKTVISKIQENEYVSYENVRQLTNIDKFCRTFKFTGFRFANNEVNEEKMSTLNTLSNCIPVLPTPILRFDKFNLPTFDLKYTVNVKHPVLDDFYFQQAHDMMFGPAPNMFYDQFMMEHSDRRLFVDNLKLSLIRKPYSESEFSYMTPKLRTISPHPHYATQMEVLYALIKRNMAAEKLTTVRDLGNLISSAFRHFKNTYFTHRFYDNYPKITYNITLIREWLRDQPATALPTAEELLPLFARKINRYKCTVKRSPKVNPDASTVAVYPALQTICYQGPWSNCIFCPVIKEIRVRFMNCLKSKYKIFTDKSLSEFEEELSGYHDRLIGAHSVEIDMKKYDKSQEDLMLEFECKIFEHFGMDDYLITLWKQMHRTSHLYDMANKIGCKCFGQRKSGDAATFIGNTIYLMLVLSFVYDLPNARLALFAGDDSLIFLENKPNYDPSPYLAGIFNLEAKLFDYKYNYYFCSKFLSFTQNGTFIIPDPAKILIKLGRHDIRNIEHLKEYIISLRDLTQCYDNILISNSINVALADRYPNSPNDLHLYLHSLIHSDSIYDYFYFNENEKPYPAGDYLPQLE